MHIVHNPVPKIYLIENNGNRWIYKNIHEATKAVYKYGLIERWWPHAGTCSIGEYHRGPDYIDFDGQFCHTSYQFIVRTESGDIITPNDLRDVYYEEKRSASYYYYQRCYQNRNNFVFRAGPVPRTGRKSWGSCWRHPKTTAERREAAYVRYDEELRGYNIRPRAKRNFRNLPSVWDDFRRGNVNSKSWKNQKRRHQWKEKE